MNLSTHRAEPIAKALPLIEVEGLGRYFGALSAVRDVSFTLNRGDILGFLGPNGAGKSTTMQMLTGNLAPSAGRVRVAGIDLRRHPKAAKAHIGYLPEVPPLYRDAGVDEFLRFCAGLHGLRGKAVVSAVDRAKQRCGLEKVGRRLIGNLSKGFQQRVGIAQAIVHEPEVVILDEPTVGLDPIQIIEIRALIAELGRAHGVIVSTHILPEVQALCNRVQIIRRGELVFSAHTDDLVATRESRLRVRFVQPGNGDALAALPGVLDVKAEGDRWVLRIDGNAGEVAEAVAVLAQEGGWGLRELTPEWVTLEQLFVDLTVHEAPPT
ncbi:MAG: ATP-binding cassette domain-containing protein [Gammaproteobacteria bacterium]|nr:ATP-binding cassette domain-containing protein [Gammaproteobacteria bacterium]MCP5136722.1 ATP-binding cassette domain-containing protein [Gammaproteobacteria bacterium]